MRKTGKASNNIIKIVYILLAIIWVAVSLLFFLVGSNLGSVGKVIYFLPTVVMLIVIVVGIIHLSKDNYKTRDAVVLAVLPWIFIVVEFAVSVSQDASRASIEVFMGSFFQGVITGIVGILIFIVKYTKQDIQENEKLSKILDNMMNLLYSIISSSGNYRKSNLFPYERKAYNDKCFNCYSIRMGFGNYWIHEFIKQRL